MEHLVDQGLAAWLRAKELDPPPAPEPPQRLEALAATEGAVTVFGWTPLVLDGSLLWLDGS